MTRIKICGIKTEEHALAAAEAGADFIGLVFARSPRQITPAQANKIVAALKASRKESPEIVGVFVNAPVDDVNRIAGFCHLDYVQLSGDENISYCRELAASVFKVMRISVDDKSEQVCRDMEAWSKGLSTRKCVFLLDAFDKEKYGGTGYQLDWDKTKLAAGRFNVILAGGLTPENVAEAINKVKPWGVDVSSGVETNGEKDIKKMVTYIKAVRDADAR